MPTSLVIRSDFSDGLESKLLRKICRRRKCKNVYVSPFRRFGLSGARLLLVYFKKKPAGLPFLLKIGALKKIGDEHAATQVLASDVEDANFAEDHIFSASDGEGKWGALLYRHRGTDRPAEAAAPQALREIIYESPTSRSNLGKILDGVFDKLANAHSTHRVRTVSIRSHFKRYFRNYAAQDRIRQVLGRDAHFNQINFLGCRILNPVKYVSSLPKRTRLSLASIHGDLHPDNIVIDRNGLPHLIDFAWAHANRDVLIDFVLLENSVRFMAFPSAGPINLSDQLKVDQAFLDENGYEQIGNLRFSRHARREDYARLACVVRCIRKRARRLLVAEFSMRKYLLTQFIVLYGLMRYKDYEPYTGTRALGLIAARLKKIGLPS
jgi:serine/threonine protein kinase